jgi:short subunit dehydrogenase-like uncharacterized protein
VSGVPRRRIVLFGATGYTGRLTAHAMVARGLRPVLAGRARDRLSALAAELGGLDMAVADAAAPTTVGALVEPGDVLVSTVGPFTRYGDAAVDAAVSAGAAYLDSTGEPGFIARVFTDWGPAAAEAGAVLLPAFGYDYVPGNLAAALALADAGRGAIRVDVGYFVTGRPTAGAFSSGTIASLLAMGSDPVLVYRGWRLQPDRMARKVRTFSVDGRARQGLSVSASEHFAVPPLVPALREVNVYNGWFGPLTRVVQGAATASALTARLPGAGAVQRLVGRAVPAQTGRGPDTDARATTRSEIVAVAYDTAGRELAAVALAGPNPYDLTAGLLAWGAGQAADGAVHGTGALGPVAAFGVPALLAGAGSAGLHRR